MPDTIDELREKYPTFGFAVYALEPGGEATLEVLTPDGTIYSFKGKTVASAIAEAFPAPAESAKPAEPEPQQGDVFA